MVALAMFGVWLALQPTLVQAFTEPSSAPPGGATAAPLNVSNTTQTKQGRLNVGTTTSEEIGLNIGSLTTPKFLCLNGDPTATTAETTTPLCIDSWSDVTGTGVQLRQAATVDWFQPELWDGTNSDSGNISVRARDTQLWAIGGRAADATAATTLVTTGVYGSSAINPPAAGKWTAGLFGLARTTDSYGLIASALAGYAAYFGGSVGINQAHPIATFVVSRDSMNGQGSAGDAGAFYASSFNSAVYAEQGALAGHAGYFSGRLSAVGRTTQDSVLRARCTSDLDPASPTFGNGGTRCLDVDLNRPTGGFVWQTFRHGYNPTSGAAGAEKWWFRSDSANFAFGLDARTGAAGSETTTSVLRATQSGNVGIADAILPNPKLLVNKGVAGNAGNANNAVDILANVTDTGLYVENPVPATPVVGTDQWAAYFSGDTNVSGRICLNDDGSRTNCISAWPSGGGGGGASYWDKTAGVIHPTLATVATDRLALGGTDIDNAPFYYDPAVASLGLNGGTLYVNGGTLTLRHPVPGGQPGPPPPEVGQSEPAGAFGRVLARLVPPAQAGLVTNPGSTPANRILVRNGVIAIDNSPPWGPPGGSKFEIGNAGRDIASTGSLYLRPFGVAASTAVTVSAVSPYAFISTPALFVTGNGSGSLGLSADVSGTGDAVSAKQLAVGNTKSALYGENASATGWAGYFAGRVNVTESLCFDGTDCRTGWPTPEGGGGGGEPGTSYWTLASVASRAFLSPKDISQAVYVGNRPASTNNTSLGVYNNSSNSALYAQQDNTAGWAGYFSGRTKVTSADAATPSFEAENTSGDANGFASRFIGVLGVHGGVPKLGDGSSASKFRFGGSGSADGLEWQLYEAENWESDAYACVNPNFSNAEASAGRTVRFAACPEPLGPPGFVYGSYRAITFPPGNYRMAIRLKSNLTLPGPTETSFGFGTRATGVDPNFGRTLADQEFTGIWQIFSFNFTISSSVTMTPLLQRRYAMSLGGYIDIDWVLITPAEGLTEEVRGATFLTPAPTDYSIQAGPVVSIRSGGPAVGTRWDCEAWVNEVTGNNDSGFGCGMDSDGDILGYISPGPGNVSCSYICWLR